MLHMGTIFIFISAKGFVLKHFQLDKEQKAGTCPLVSLECLKSIVDEKVCLKIDLKLKHPVILQKSSSISAG